MIRIYLCGRADRSGYCIGNQRTEADYTVSVFRMHGVDEQDDGRVVIWVNQDGSTRISCVPEGVRAEEVAMI